MNNLMLWIIQMLLAALFGMSGIMKITQPKNKLKPREFSAKTIRFIGVCEFLGALGLILPMAFGIAAILTPLSAAGLGLIMIGASIHHVTKKEYSGSLVTITLLILSAIVAYGRF